MNPKRHESWTDLTAAAEWWRKLASDEIRAYELGIQTNKGTAEFRAWVYERTAKAIEIERDTGVSVCSCCHKPLSGNACDNH